MADNEATETEAAINWLASSTSWHAWVTDEAQAAGEAAIAADDGLSYSD